ncbi:hypothetical protein BM221_008335 [Beauveria bassiana]|uniref:Uncharacterized protein n=1 Tax=Beauveria bassiana TaxID=176275 RepID=A0A2N6NFS3_BEABA|nr:hypothetical protein BM221_008335 [Beauveria bassiana]
MHPSESWLATASAALDHHPPIPATALAHAQVARRICHDRFADSANRYLYLGLRWEVEALEVLAARDWAEAIKGLRIACGAYRLARHCGRGTWIERAGGRGVRRCMAMGVYALGAG